MKYLTKFNFSTSIKLSFPAICLAIAFLVALISLSATSPPIQSPDEVDHVKRAYLLTQGVIALESPPSKNSGGQIDTGLQKYIHRYWMYTFSSTDRIPKQDVEFSRKIRWSGKKAFEEAPGTGFYFPALYAPQAIGLALGESLSLSIDTSYRLARLFAILFSVTCLCLAFSLQLPSPFIVALIALPMSIYQFSTTSLDGVSNALAILSISIFLRLVRGLSKKQKETKYIWILSIFIFLIGSSRAHLAPLVLLVFGLFPITKNKHAIVAGIASAILIVAWMSIALRYNIDTRSIKTPPSEIASFYINNPSALFRVLVNTTGNSDILNFYHKSFIGNLGSLSAPLTETQYQTIGVALGFLLLTSLALSFTSTLFGARAILLVTGASSAILIFIALLINWTPHPASTIEGIQGRYFFIPILLLSYAAFGFVNPKGRFASLKQSLLYIPILFLTYTTYISIETLLIRYYLTTNSNRLAFVESTSRKMNFGALSSGRVFEQSFISAGPKIFNLELFLATYARKNSGKIALEIIDAQDLNTIYKQELDLKNINDNEWLVIYPENMNVTPNHPYIIRLSSMGNSPQNSITWWASSSDEYKDGMAIVDSRRTRVDFAFKVGFEK